MGVPQLHVREAIMAVVVVAIILQAVYIWVQVGVQPILDMKPTL